MRSSSSSSKFLRSGRPSPLSSVRPRTSVPRSNPCASTWRSKLPSSTPRDAARSSPESVPLVRIVPQLMRQFYKFLAYKPRVNLELDSLNVSRREFVNLIKDANNRRLLGMFLQQRKAKMKLLDVCSLLN